MRDYLTLSWARFSKDVQSHTLQISKILSHPAPRPGELVRLDASSAPNTASGTQSGNVGHGSETSLEVVSRFPGGLDFGRGLVDVNFTMWPLFKCLNIDNILTICEVGLPCVLLCWNEAHILCRSRSHRQDASSSSPATQLCSVLLSSQSSISSSSVVGTVLRWPLFTRVTQRSTSMTLVRGSWVLQRKLDMQSAHLQRSALSTCKWFSFMFNVSYSYDRYSDINYLNCSSPPPGIVSTKQQRDRYRQRLMAAFEPHYHPDHCVPRSVMVLIDFNLSLIHAFS